MKKILLILTALTVSAAAFAEKITTVAEITSGYKYYIGATTGGNDYYFYVDGSSKTESIKGVAKEDKAEAVALTFTAVTGGWTIKFDNGLYLGIKNAKDNGAVQVLDEAMVWTIEEDKGLLKLHPNDYYLQKNNSGTQFGSYKPTQTNVWLESAGSAPVLATLDSLVIKGKAEKMEYELGEAFDLAGLEVWGIYTKIEKHDSTSQIKSGITWRLYPETFEEASDNESVTLSASYKDLTSADTTITSIKVKQKPVKYTTYENWQLKHEGSEWEWTENMTKVEEGLFKLKINWTGSGFNVKSDENPIKKDWYDPFFDPNDFHIAEEVIPPTTVDVYLRVIDDETLKIGIGEAPPIQFVDTASGLKFEITSMEEPRTVKVINNEYPGTSYTVPGTVTYGEKTFDVTEIGVEAFHDCASLESITLPESVTTLAYASLAASGLKSITIPATVTTIGEYAFAGCPLQSVTFQGNACQDTIGDNAFEDVGTTTTPATLTLPDDWAGSTPENSETPWYGGYFDYDAPAPASGPTVDETGITVNGRKYGFPVRLVKEVK